MRPQTKLIRTSRWIDQQKPNCKRWDPYNKRLETDSVLYTQLLMLQNRIGQLLQQLDQQPSRRYKYN